MLKRENTDIYILLRTKKKCLNSKWKIQKIISLLLHLLKRDKKLYIFIRVGKGMVNFFRIEEETFHLEEIIYFEVTVETKKWW